MPYSKENVATAVTKSRRSISGNAKRKFRNFYWPKFFKIDDAKELNHKVLSKTLIDTYLRRTSTITQTAINSIIKENNIHLDLLEVDGVMGKLTINAINELNKISVDIFNQSYYITREDVFKSKTTMSKILRVANLFNKEDF